MKKLVVLILAFIVASCSDDSKPPTVSDTYQINVGNPVLVVEDGYHSKWSPDDNYIAYTKVVGESLEIWLCETATNTTRCQVSGVQGDLTVSWKSDGTAIVFDGYQGAFNSQVWVSDITTGTVEKVTNYVSQLFFPEWLHNSPQFVAGSQMSLYLMDEDGSNVQLIGDNNLRGWSCAVDFNDQRIAFTSDMEGNDDIWIVNLDGSNLRRITTDPSHDGRPRWSPDGTKLVFESDRSGITNIWIYDFNTSSFAQVTTTGGNMPDWSHQGDNIVYVTEQGQFYVHIEEIND